MPGKYHHATNVSEAIYCTDIDVLILIPL